MLGIEQAVVNHLERNSSVNQRLVDAERMVLDFRAGLRTSVELRRLLRIDNRYTRDRFQIAQVTLRFVVPGVEILDDFQSPLIVNAAGNLVEPGPKAVGDSVDHP